MNCLEFRRQLVIEPESNVVDFVAHRESCERCAEAHARALGFESTLKRALAVAVPEGLAERVLLRQTTEARTAARAPGRRGLPLWRLAAGIVLAVGAAALWSLGRPAPTLPDLAVAHLAHEPYALSSRAPVAAEQVRAVFASSGTPLPGDPGEVHYLALCPLGKDRAIHMVVQRPEGPVTVYVVVNHDLDGRQVFERGGIKGRSVGVPAGALVLVASDSRGFDQVEQAWLEALGATPGAALGVL